MGDEPTVSEWIAHVFDHPVTRPEWYWSDDADEWEEVPADTLEFAAETFENSEEMLAPFSDAQLNQGFWYLLSDACSGDMRAIGLAHLSMAARLRVVRSFVPLFEQTMARRCSPHLSHLDEQPANPLNGACYMWWDLLPISSGPSHAEHAELDAEVITVLARLLAIPHDACRESALHGIGHWLGDSPIAEEIVDDWLACTPGLRPELVTYAKRAKVGDVL